MHVQYLHYTQGSCKMQERNDDTQVSGRLVTKTVKGKTPAYRMTWDVVSYQL